MFQTFSGSSRRPRQVNLSGQNANPFAAVSGVQNTVANAQQERQQRQHERDRLNASKRIQKTWRGHRVRTELADSRRRIWDERSQKSQSPSDSGEVLVEQSKLVVAFFSSRRPDDIERMVTLSQNIHDAGCERFLGLPEVKPLLKRLAHVTLHALQSSIPQYHSTLLQFLVTIIDQNPKCFPPISKAYYTYLSDLCSKSGAGNKDKELVLATIKAPLVQHVDSSKGEELIAAHSAFALNFLTTPNLSKILGSLDRLAAVTDVGLVSAALVREFTNSSFEIQSEARLWLLAHFICLHRLQQRDGQEPDFLRALSIQLSSSANDIVGRVDVADQEMMHESSAEDSGREVIPPFPEFIKNELLSLVNQASITGLLAKFNIDNVKASAKSEEDASLLASFALTLLRIFPRRGDEIRMWLYLGSISTSAGNELPSLKFFWQAMSKTNTFTAIRADSKAALSILRPQMKSSSTSSAPADVITDREWRTILLFLELYTFVLRFTDDEEFLHSQFGQVTSQKSRIRASALPLEDVMRLTIFLKNLAFTTYYNAGELSDGGQQVMEGGLGSYFGIASTGLFQSKGTEEAPKRVVNRPFAGIAGMTFDYVRTIVTGVMRMLYERDSRRGFLPKGHWLMTSRFDMEGFIPSVVSEEERQHEIGEDGDGDDEDDGGFEPSQENRSEMGLVGMGRPRRVMAIEAMRRQQQKATRKKALAAIGPRLEVLQNMPFVIPFETRVQIFRQFVHRDQSRRRDGNVDPDVWRMSIVQQSHMASRPGRGSARELLGRHHAKIRRDQVFEDAYEQFFELGEGLKEPIQITFVDQFDTVEAGIDGGGVTKEFLTSVTNEAFRGEDGPKWFISNDQNLLYPNPSAVDERREWLKKIGLVEGSLEWRENIAEVLRRYEFLGRVVGKCLYEGILIDIGFAGFFLLKWATASHEYRANINDLRDFDESLYQGLLKLKNYPGNVEDFSLDFTITDTISPPGEPTQTITRDLMPNGWDIPVTNENRTLYISYVARHRLQVQPYQQTQAFLKGLGDIIKPTWLSMFNQSELQTLVGGDSSEIDVEDLRENTQYGGVYQIGDDGLEHTTIQMFWQVLKNLDDSDRRKVLKYVTSTPRAPLLGFSQLNPRFSIRDAGRDETRLPSTSTCVNLLKLPMYTTIGVLKQKLLYAVNSGAGFDLS